MSAAVALTWTGVLMTGCAEPRIRLSPTQRAVLTQARPILTLDPDADWTDAYNSLLKHGADAIDVLINRPVMTTAARPGDLRVLLHTSLIRLLSGARDAPRLSLTAFETSLGLLHLDLKVDAKRIGALFQHDRIPPADWHDLLPGDFDHALAAEVDLERDRRALRDWWRARREAPHLTPPPLQPGADSLWTVLSRRYADRWEYAARPAAYSCAQDNGTPPLMILPTYDYNLVRAACVRLGSDPDPRVQAQLIELVGHPRGVVRHNAVVALEHSRDPRIRALLERFKQREPAEPNASGTRTAAEDSRRDSQRTWPRKRRAEVGGHRGGDATAEHTARVSRPNADVRKSAQHRYGKRCRANCNNYYRSIFVSRLSATFYDSTVAPAADDACRSSLSAGWTAAPRRLYSCIPRSRPQARAAETGACARVVKGDGL